MTHEFDEPTNEELRSLSRRGAIRLLGGGLVGAGLVGGTLAACASDAPGAGATSQASAESSAASSSGVCTLIPEETSGPYPLDLSGDEAFVRTDLTEDRDGVPLTFTLAVADASRGCTPIEGARIDVWHCDALGVYSGFAQPGSDTTGETFLRGIQLTGEDGEATFTTIFPGWYPGRFTHIHFQVFTADNLVATSQFTFEATVIDAVSTRAQPYAKKGPNTSVPDAARDGVFRDGSAGQVMTLTGDVASGFTGTLPVNLAKKADGG